MATTTRNDDVGLDDLDPSTAPARDASHFRAIVAANEELSNADAALRDVVRAARDAGDSWTVIGAAFGVSKQAAQERFSQS